MASNLDFVVERSHRKTEKSRFSGGGVDRCTLISLQISPSPLHILCNII